MVATQAYIRRPADGSLYDVLDLILDKGLVIDAYVRVSLVGIELLTVDARVVVASVDTYLRFAERADRLVLGTNEKRDIGDLLEGGASYKTRGALKGGWDSVKEAGTSLAQPLKSKNGGQGFQKVKSKLRGKMDDMRQAMRRDEEDEIDDTDEDDE
jgi:gas vesicle structural protein